jgi:hypothetical protein
MNKLSLLVRYLSLGTILVTLAACQLSSKPTKEDLVGMWVEQFVNQSTSNICGTFEFFEDGRFEAKNIPSDHFIQKGYLPERINTRGTWILDITSDDPFAVHQIELIFSPIKGFPDGFESVLYLSVDGDLLFHGVDNRVLFGRGECK